MPPPRPIEYDNKNAAHALADHGAARPPTLSQHPFKKNDESYRRYRIQTDDEKAWNQLMRWAYETSAADLTLTERLEKSKWQTGRQERL